MYTCFHLALHAMITNRNVSNIKGFSRETLVALIANIESREWRRQFCLSNGLPGEHPRASTTDDVECFFSVLRDSVGKDFTLKEVCFRKHINLELLLDVELGYLHRALNV